MTNWWNKNKPKGIFKPEEDEYKGYPILKIPVGEDGEPFAFGLKKAKAILMFRKAIEDFVARHDK